MEFMYGEKELSYLRGKDKRLGAVIDQLGLRMVYRHKNLDRDRFERYRRRFSPYGSVASLYLWAVAGGAVPGLTDPAPGKASGKSKKG